jgi:hypothetical protein
VVEQEQLRGEHLVAITSPFPLSNATRYLGDWANQAGNQSEVIIRFARPTTPGDFGIDVMTANKAGAKATRVFVSYLNSTSLRVGVGQDDPGMLTNYMAHTDLPGGDFNVTNVNYTDPHVCEQACFADPKCQAYTYVVRPPLYASCCQKGADGWGYNPNDAICTSGVRNPKPAPGASKTAVLTLLPSDTEVEVRVFVDNTFLEAYWQDGRVAMTATLMGTEPEAGMSVFASGQVQVTAVDVWRVNSIWISPEEVLEQMKQAQ